jgi:peptide/nickel transport system substrate-binding protein
VGSSQLARTRGLATELVVVASLAVALGPGGAAPVTAAPPSAPIDLTGECSRDIAGAAVDTAASPTERPESAIELDANAVIDINEQPRANLQQGGTLRRAVASLADNWNRHHPDGYQPEFADIVEPMSYRPWLIDAQGAATINPDFVAGFTESDDHLTVTYTLNPDAVWHSGDPITADDWIVAWNALNGSDGDFRAASTDGYDRITDVEQGVDRFQVVITFCAPYPDYEALFSEIGPAEAYADPDTFNAGWIGPINNDWYTGPFELGRHDAAAGVVTLVPSDTWWGPAPLLESIEYLVMSDDAAVQAFADGAIDALDIGPDPAGYARARNTPGSEIRAAAGPNWRNVTMNSGPNGGLIQDQVVRQAIQMSLDRAAIATSDLAGLPWPARPLDNHVFVANSPFYVDNAEPWGRYDPEAAIARLEDSGWVAGADGVRVRDGERLAVRFSRLVGVPVSENEAALVSSQLAAVGFEVELVDVPVDEFGRTLSTGDFELIAFSWIGTPFPFRGAEQLYGSGSSRNYAFSTIPEADVLLGELATTVDDEQRAAIANAIDVILWEYGHTIPLYQRPELIATASGLANFGAFGLMTPAIWTDVGWSERARRASEPSSR